MKKKKNIKKLVIPFLLLSSMYGTVNGNRDLIDTITYGTEFDLKVTAKYSATNSYCPKTQNFSGDITDILNPASGSCSKSGNTIKCDKTEGFYDDNYAPASSITEIISLNASGNQVISKLGIPEKLKVSGGDVKANINSTLYLLTDMYGENSPIQKSATQNIDIDLGNYTYTDSTECPKYDIVERTGYRENKDGKKESYTYTERVPKPTEVKIPGGSASGSNPPSATPNGNGTSAGSIRRDITSVNYNDDNFPNSTNCKKIGENEFACYATDKNIEFGVGVENTGSYSSNTVMASINNGDNTAPANGVTDYSNNIRAVEKMSSGKTTIGINGGFFKKEGTYTIVFQGFGDTNYSYSGGIAAAVKLKIVPNPNYLVTEIKKENEKPEVTSGKTYSNDKDSYKIDIIVKDKFDNLIKNKDVKKIICDNTKTTKNQCLLDLDLKSGIVSKNLKSTNNNGYTDFKITSSVPNKYEKNQIVPVIPLLNGEIQKWDPEYKNIDNQTSPFEVKLKDKKTFEQPILFSGTSVSGKNINVSKKQGYTISLKNDGGLKDFSGEVNGINTTNITLNENYKFSEELKNENFNGKIKDYDTSVTKNDLNVGFVAIVKALLNEKITKKIDLFIKDLSLILTYDFNSYKIEYPLRDLAGITDTCEIKTTGLILNGKTLAKGKESHTSEVSTFTNISKADLKKTVDKNAKNLVRGLESGKKYNGVLYFDEDVTYSSVKSKLEENDSLIIKNGNLLIDENIDKTIGIVVLADNFKPEINKNNKGNIFVKNIVKEINAYLYADGGLISADDLNGTKYTDEKLAENRLDLNGSLVSSNTVGGGEKGESSCFLPGNKKTNNCVLAERYDLNYLRKRIIQCEDKLSGEDKKLNYSFKVNYNPAIQTKTPKVFKNN